MSTTEKNEKSIKGLLLLAMLLGAVIGGISYPYLFKRTSKSIGRSDKVQEVFNMIGNEYVDSMNKDSLETMMLDGMLAELDPHSHYFTASDLKKEEERISGGFDGVGIILRYRNDTVFANSVIPGSPAERCGIQPGDRIMMVGNDSVTGVKMAGEDVVNLIRGRKGTFVTLSILRGPNANPMNIRLVRGSIATPTVPYSGLLSNKTGYIKIQTFGQTTYREFHSALYNLKTHFVDTLIIDLRGNGGGLLDAAIDIANDLLPNGSLIVYTEGAHQKRVDTYARGRAFYEGHVIIMIDEQSASASEVVSGAIQDNDRGVIVGRRSFGKGLVQRQMDLSDGSAVWLTVARYYTPSGRCIQRPYDKGTDEYYTSYLERMITEMENDSIVSSVTDTTKYFTKQGRVVYGGGGIFPDHVLSYHRDPLLVYVNNIFNKGCISDMALDYVVMNFANLKSRYNSADDFVNNFKVSDNMMRSLEKRASDKGIKYDAPSARKYDQFIRTLLKAYIGESLFDMATFYRINATNDHELQQVLSDMCSWGATVNK